MKATLATAAVLALAVTPAAQAQGAHPPMKAAPGASAATLPLVDGEIRKIDLDKGLVVLRHGDIANLGMPAMTMGFDIADRKMVQGLKVGDKVKFQAEMVKGKATVTKLTAVR